MKSIHLDTSHHVKKTPCRHPVRGEILFHCNGDIASFSHCLLPSLLLRLLLFSVPLYQRLPHLLKNSCCCRYLPSGDLIGAGPRLEREGWLFSCVDCIIKPQA
jgi:hypothetical protein